MSDSADEGVLVAFEYIERHQRAWARSAAALIGEIARLLRSLEFQQVPVGYLGASLHTHENAINFTRDRADEGVEAVLNIARALEEIKSFYETNDALSSRILRARAARGR
jgi:hypothetical protein